MTGDDVATGAAVTIRALAPAEIARWRDRLLALAIAAKGTWGYDDDFMARFARDMADELETLAGPPDGTGAVDGRGAVDAQIRSVVLVAEAGADLLGFAVLRDRGDHAWLDDLWVDAGHQGRGAGRALWEAAARLAYSWGRTRLEVEADPNAEAFYHRMGARTIGHRESSYRAGRRLPLMRVDLER